MSPIATRRKRTRVLATFLACGAGWSCSPRAAPRQTQEAPPPLASVPPVVANDRKPATPPDPCHSLAPNEVSDDETPSIASASQAINPGSWLEARGVSKATFRTWVRSRDPKNLEDFDADSLFDSEGSCQPLTVGDKREDGLVCALAVRTSIMRFSALAFVVRNKRITTVLEVGYALLAMDWPDARWLDLQLTFAPDGLKADLHDRAKPGTVLVLPPSVCRAYLARYVACDKAHRDGAPLDDVCPRQMDPSGTLSFGHLSPTMPTSPMGAERVELRGCAEALPKLDDLVKGSRAKDGAKNPILAEFRGDRAFAITSCNARGRYVWKDGRFVRAASGGP